MTADDPFAALSDAARERLERRRQPGWIDPMLATLTDAPFSNPDWIYERKLDGVRVLAFRVDGEARLSTRNRNDVSAAYPEIVEALGQKNGPDFIADAEVVAFDGKVTSFSRLQRRIGLRDPDATRASGVAVYLYVFDLPHFDGHDLGALGTRERKRVLKAALAWNRRVRFTPHRNEHGERLHADACRRGWEGLIAKAADAPYANARSRRWLKLKCVARQELVIGGFTPPQGEREGLGALLVGYHEDDRLRYAGRVGTGFDRDTLEALAGRLARIERRTSPFAEAVDVDAARWVTPKLVCEVGFAEWTRAGRLRHPRYVGLREDKPAADVVRERPAA